MAAKSDNVDQPDVVFTVEYSVRVGQMAVYELLKFDHEIPPISHHDHSLEVNFEAVIKAFELDADNSGR